MIGLTNALRSLKAPVHRETQEGMGLAGRIAQALHVEGDNLHTGKKLISEALEGNLREAMELLAMVLPNWGMGDGVNQPSDRFVAQLYSPTGTVVEGEGTTFVLAVIDAMISAKNLSC